MFNSFPKFGWYVLMQDGAEVYNVFSGSVGTDENNGMTRCKTFNYTVYVDHEDKENYKFVAKCFIQLPYCDNFEKINCHESSFEHTKEGYEQAMQWLAAEKSTYFDPYAEEDF